MKNMNTQFAIFRKKKLQQRARQMNQMGIDRPDSIAKVGKPKKKRLKSKSKLAQYLSYDFGYPLNMNPSPIQVQ